MPQHYVKTRTTKTTHHGLLTDLSSRRTPRTITKENPHSTQDMKLDIHFFNNRLFVRPCLLQIILITPPPLPSRDKKMLSSSWVLDLGFCNMQGERIYPKMWTQQIVSFYENDMFELIWLRNQHQGRQIGLVGYSWIKWATKFIGVYIEGSSSMTFGWVYKDNATSKP